MDAYPNQTNDHTPDETMFALFPDGHAEQGVCRESVHSYEDVRGGEAETEASQGLGGGTRTRTCGHFGRIKIYSIFDFSVFGNVFICPRSGCGTE